MMLGTFQYALLRGAGVFLGLVLATEDLYQPADVSGGGGWSRGRELPRGPLSP